MEFESTTENSATNSFGQGMTLESGDAEALHFKTNFMWLYEMETCQNEIVHSTSTYCYNQCYLVVLSAVTA